MKLAKKKAIPFAAFRLGENDPLEQDYIANGQISHLDNGMYEIFSQEAKDGKGEYAKKGDYVKIDMSGYPYPNSKEFFESKCINVGKNLYQQISSPVEVWFADDPVCEFVEFLLKSERLRIDETNDDKYFNAFLWGAPLSAARDSAVVAYSVTRDTEGKVIDVDFNFVVKDFFDEFYEWC